MNTFAVEPKSYAQFCQKGFGPESHAMTFAMSCVRAQNRELMDAEILTRNQRGWLGYWSRTDMQNIMPQLAAEFLYSLNSNNTQSDTLIRIIKTRLLRYWPAIEYLYT